jgi:hypothetical protein
MKQGLESQTKVQRYPDFMNNSNDKEVFISTFRCTFPTKSFNENLVVALVGIRIEFLVEYSIIMFMQMIN